MFIKTLAGSDDGRGAERLAADLGRLERRLLRVYDDVNCRGRLERYRELFPAAQAPQSQPADAGASRLLGELLPLSQVLIGLGYFDVALQSAEIAANHAPGWEAQLTRAFLLALLGETETAEELYVEAHHALGQIPGEALGQLEELVATHPDEEDLAELHMRLMLLAPTDQA